MKKKLLAFTIIMAMLISVLSISSVFAAAEPSWIWKPAEDGYSSETLGTGTDAADKSYTTFSSSSREVEGFAFPGESMDLSATSLGIIDPEDGSIVLIKYRTTADASVSGELVWSNDFDTFANIYVPYTNDGEWHFAIVDLTDFQGAGAWKDLSNVTCFRFDFVNNTNNQSYSLDLAYLAIFASESDAQAYADADTQGTTPEPGKDDNKDDNKNDNKDDNKGDTQPPKTGDVDIIVAVAAAGLVLTVVLKKRLAA